MPRRVLPRNFYARPATTVAGELIGKVLVRRVQGRELSGVIIETEAYAGPHDLASHSSKGRTARTEVMFGEPGRWYVFFNYGVHWMLNAVTGERGHAAAVLLRGVDGVIGPGRLTRKFGVDKTLYGKAIAPASGLWIEDRGIRVPRRVLRRSPRIGIDYAGPVWAKKPYRFHIDKRYLTSAAWKDKITSMTGSHLIVNTEKKSKKPSGEG